MRKKLSNCALFSQRIIDEYQRNIDAWEEDAIAKYKKQLEVVSARTQRKIITLDGGSKNMSNNEDSLDGGIAKILRERQKTHGIYQDHAVYTQDIKAVCARSPNHDKMTPDLREGLDMIAHKVGRILAGDPTVADHWRDIAGYATLCANACEGRP